MLKVCGTILSCLIFAACFGEPEPQAVGCNDCHGNGESPAPPVSLGDLTAIDQIGVGAHRAHLNSPKLSRKVSCNECHIVPEKIDSPGHIDSSWPAELKWGALSKTGTVVPIWNRETKSCSGVYCHGASLGGGLNSAPIWTLTDGSQITCGSCHATPPPPPHPAGENCGECHAPTGGQGITIANFETHIDGVVQLVGPTPCGGCHGDATSLAPTIGAHRAHTSGGKASAAVACSDCHVVPTAVNDAGHIDAPPAEVRFQGVAVRNGAMPVFDGTTCTNTYCHALASSGGTVPAPAWNDTTGSASACGACHGVPPPSPHPSASACGNCHTVRPATHVDGVTQF